ncbi:MAG: DUF21 domain-containing protein, partial [Kamptonema sp. SIO4C4]|nr:DUF21 domain-containing protein [Kamptonema sp. SIO4C4]
MASVAQEILIIVCLLVINGTFAMSEIALVSANKIRLAKLSEQGERRAAIALKLSNNPNRILSTVQIGITLVGIFAGAFSGATIADHFSQLFEQIPILAAHSDAIALFLVVLILTHLWLVMGELIPKRIALSHPEKIATLVATPLHWLSKWVAPIVYLLGASTDAVVRLLGISLNQSEPSVTQDELKVMLKQGTEAGTLMLVFGLMRRPAKRSSVSDNS